jgi:hypothetical protein
VNRLGFDFAGNQKTVSGRGSGPTHEVPDDIRRALPPRVTHRNGLFRLGMILGRIGRYATLEAVLSKNGQLLENLHPMPIDLPRKSITEAFRVGMNRITVG